MTTERARFINSGTTPPIGWIYGVEHEGTKFDFQAPMKSGLMKQLRDWYRAKELEWPGDAEMSARIEHFICVRGPKGFCVGGPNNLPVPYLSVSMIRDGTRLLVRRLFNRVDFFVDQQEADRRAKICANCPKNLRGICVSCVGNEFFDIFGWFIRAGKKTPYDSILGTCSVCRCLLRAKAWVSMATLGELSKHTYPENCFLYGSPAHVPGPPAEDQKNEAEEILKYPAP